MQALLGVFGLTEFLLIYFLFPETSQPGARGIDKLTLDDQPQKFIFVNPLRPLALLRSPNLLFIVSLDQLRALYQILIIIHSQSSRRAL